MGALASHVELIEVNQFSFLPNHFRLSFFTLKTIVRA